ncbi:hypothetical protein [Nonomuraea glycinis]|uniref:hypothetical protein n=1 Tax=Nonomuraea glycinis TaxID=2047744 RepID=UPI0033B6F10F
MTGGSTRWETDPNTKSLFLARVPYTGSFELLDQQFWTYYGGPASNGAAQWVTSCSTAVPLTPKSEVEFSVTHLNGQFWLVHHTPASQAPGNIVAVPSLTPWGIGTQQIDLYTPPETQTSTVKASCWTRGYYFPDNQYPRFIDVPVTAFFTPKTP